MRVYGAVGDPKSTNMDISNFPTSYYNPCQKDRWYVICVVYDTISLIVTNPEPRTPNPEPRTPNPEPRSPNPEP